MVPWEIAIKTRRGRLNAELLLDDWPTAMETIGAQALEIAAEDAIRAGALDWGHRDPFDRMIVAQAQLRGLTVVTSDGTILNFGLVPSLEL